ncbi:hypothetical protein M569_08719 [Genlisea aurea]|uniref:Uncharacterized protein n=1 Tax=Genlisea aurea TaxID=192259 RepID=S8DSE3_9LAMI|nr:hypothetical protein M569_08719 [Genlisea aurea]
MGLIISNPQDFWKLAVMSFVSVTMATGIYTLHVYKLRKHFIHLKKLNSYWFT